MSKRPHIPQTQVKSLSLFNELMDHLDAQEDELLAKVWTQGKDAARRFSATQRQSIYRRDGGRCFYCQTLLPASGWHADHVIPHSRGGRTVIFNGVASCPPCNRAKSNKVW